MTKKNDRPDPLNDIGLHLPHLDKASSGVSGLGLLMNELLLQKTEAEDTEKTLFDNIPIMEGLTGVGMVLDALLIGGDYETPGDRLIDNMRLVGGLYSCIEALAWAISLELDSIKSGLELYYVEKRRDV